MNPHFPCYTLEKYALLVGVNEYQSGKLATLAYTENDVVELGKILRANGFTVRILSNSAGKKDKADAPTAKNLRAALDEITAKKTKHDTMLIALSGHGLQLEVHDPDEKGKPRSYSYFCPSDADLRSPVRYSTGKCDTLLPIKDVFDMLDECGAGTRLVLMDACRNELKAEASTRSLDVDRFRIPKGVGAMFSCSAGQKAFEAETYKHGVFFHFVLEGLRDKAKNKRGEVTWDRLTEYVKEQVSETVPALIGGGAKQEPHAVSSLAGRSPVLARVAAKEGSGKENDGGLKPIKDEGNFFGKEAQDKANKKIRELYQKYKKDIVIETLASLTEEQEKKLEAESPKNFFGALAEARAKELGLNGLYILICKKPRDFTQHADPESMKKVFIATRRDRIFAAFRVPFREEKYDAGLLAGLDEIEAALKAGAK